MGICTNCGRNDQEPLAPCPSCAIGDQADPDLDELAHLRAEVKRLQSTSQELEIDRLRTELAKHQSSEFHPDWSLLKATQHSLREHMALVKAAQAEKSEAIGAAAALEIEIERLNAVCADLIAEERAACAKVARRGHLMAIIPGETKQDYGARLASIIAFEIAARGKA